MAIGVKVLDAARSSRSSYVRATLKGMALTFKHLVDPHKVTMQYPGGEVGALAALARHAPHAHDGGRQGEVRGVRPLPDGLPGQLHQARAGRGRERAIAIRSCSRSTSSAASSAATARKSVRRRRSTSGRHYENSEYSREGFVYDLERLMAQTHPVCEMWDPADPKGE